MAAPNRSAQFAKLHKVLKKHYAATAPDLNRSVLEHLLFASCLENAHYAPAEESLAALVHTFFDWNEIRVSTVRELAEVMSSLPDPQAAATRVKKILQTIFEGTYSFDLEELRKQNIGPAIERLQKIEGTTRFSIAYVTQAALGGHSIPIDSGTMDVMRLLDFVSETDAAEGTVPGLERAIAKNAGPEFSSLLHQLGADYVANPYGQSLHATLVEIEPSVKPRLPSRRAKKAETEAETATTAAAADGQPAEKAKKTPAAKQEQKPSAKPPVEPAKESAKPAKGAAKEKHAPKAAEPVKEKHAATEAAPEAKKKPAAEKKAVEPEPAKGKAKKDKEAAAPHKAEAKKKLPAKKGGREAATEGLAKRKPR